MILTQGQQYLQAHLTKDLAMDTLQDLEAGVLHQGMFTLGIVAHRTQICILEVLASARQERAILKVQTRFLEEGAQGVMDTLEHDHKVPMIHLGPGREVRTATKK